MAPRHGYFDSYYFDSCYFDSCYFDSFELLSKISRFLSISHYSNYLSQSSRYDYLTLHLYNYFEHIACTLSSPHIYPRIGIFRNRKILNVLKILNYSLLLFFLQINPQDVRPCSKNYWAYEC